MVFFIDHAVERMTERGFTVDDAKAVLYDGAVAVSSVQKKGGRFRHARQMTIRGKVARVIFTESADRFDIYTVFWVRE